MKTIKKPVQVEINVKKSQFICSLFPTKNKKESKEIIQRLNQQYSDATHNCTAYIVGDGEGFDDDGEPGGGSVTNHFEYTEKGGWVQKEQVDNTEESSEVGEDKTAGNQ